LPVAYVASLSGCSPSRHRGHRLLRRTYPDVPPALGLGDPPPRPPRTRPHRVTDQPTAAWAAQQIVHSFPDETDPAYLLRDRDAIFGADFQRRVERMGIRQVVIAPRAPWQNPFAERVIGSTRRECLDLVMVLNERHLRRLLRSYLVYYNVTRPHQSLDNNSPRRREVQSVGSGRIVAVPEVGGLHHRYQRAA
jgi:putative transposase